MKRLTAILLIPIAVAVAQPPMGQEDILKLAQDLRDKGSQLLYVHADTNGTSMYYALSQERLAGSPEWDGTGEPPLDQNKATEIARAHLSEKHPEHDSFTLLTASLLPIANQTYSNKWCYKLEFQISTTTYYDINSQDLGIVWPEGSIIEEPPDDPRAQRTKYTTFRAYTLLDGSIIKGTLMENETANKRLQAIGDKSPQPDP
jgi:hypothetical protein